MTEKVKNKVLREDLCLRNDAKFICRLLGTSLSVVL